MISALLAAAAALLASDGSYDLSPSVTLVAGSAYELTLSHGEIVQGKFVRGRNGVLEVQTANGPTILPAYQVEGAKAIVWSPPPEPTPEPVAIESTYDKFRNVTTVKFTVGEMEGCPFDHFAAGVTSTGTNERAPSTAWALFFEKSDEWEYLRSHDVTFLLDGSKRIALKGSHDGNVGSGYVTEAISVMLTHAQLSSIGAAKTVEVQVGSTECALPAEVKTAIKQTAARTKPRK